MKPADAINAVAGRHPMSREENAPKPAMKKLMAAVNVRLSPSGSRHASSVNGL
jgi:hypothetical protein